MKKLCQLNLTPSSSKANCYFNKSDDSWVNGVCSLILTGGSVSFLIDKNKDWLLDQYILMKHDNLTKILIETNSNYIMLTNCKYFMNELYEDNKKGIHIKYDFSYSESESYDKLENGNTYSETFNDKVKKMILDFKLNTLSQ